MEQKVEQFNELFYDQNIAEQELLEKVEQLLKDGLDPNYYTKDDNPLLDYNPDNVPDDGAYETLLGETFFMNTVDHSQEILIKIFDLFVEYGFDVKKWGFWFLRGAFLSINAFHPKNMNIILDKVLSYSLDIPSKRHWQELMDWALDENSFNSICEDERRVALNSYVQFKKLEAYFKNQNFSKIKPYNYCLNEKIEKIIIGSKNILEKIDTMVVDDLFLYIKTENNILVVEYDETYIDNSINFNEITSSKSLLEETLNEKFKGLIFHGVSLGYKEVKKIQKKKDRNYDKIILSHHTNLVDVLHFGNKDYRIIIDRDDSRDCHELSFKV